MARRPNVERAPGLFSTLLGRPAADISGSTTGDLRGQLIAAFGPAKRTPKGEPTRPNVQAAAKGLGVTERTVQRWLADPTKQHYTPRKATAEKIATTARKAVSTKRGRQRAVRQAKESKTGAASNAEGRLTVTGEQGPEEGYARMRTVNFDVPFDLYDEMIDSFVQDGEPGVMDFLRDNIDVIYAMGSWYFGTLESVTIHGAFGGR